MSAKPDTKTASSTRNSIVEVRVILPRHLHFVPDNHQLPFDPFINYPRPIRLRYIPPNNLPSLKKMNISRDFYKKNARLFSLKIFDFIQRYNGDEDLISIHGCDSKNKTGLPKLIDYRNGDFCFFPTQSNGQEFNDVCNNGSLTRYMFFSFYRNTHLFKNKGQTIFNYRTNQFDRLSDTPNRDNFRRLFQIKDLFLKSNA